MLSKLPYLLMVFAVVLLSSCENGKRDDLQTKVDSLEVELERSHKATETLMEIGVLLDSIEASRRMLRINLVEGTQYDDYAARMTDLNNYIKATEERIEDLERSLSSSRANARAFSKTIAQLKAELATKNQEMAFLQEEVDKIRNENENLMITVNLQDAELEDKQSEIDTKNQELALIEARVQELMIQSKISEADAYYTRAEAIEIAADRTKLAPRKKKETMKEALELYKKALSLGKSEAQAKISQLEKSL